MSFEPLPRVYITWDESAEDLNIFLRYQVYRRILGDTVWSKRARINDRGITFWDDTLPHSGVTYEYIVTQIIDVSGEEVESEDSEVVSGLVHILDVFIHDVRAPENYAQFWSPTQDVQIYQPIAYVQPWSRRVPTAHVGHVLSKTYTFSVMGTWNDDVSAIGKDQWRALFNLIDRQHEVGSIMMVRQDHDVAYFGVIDGSRRSEQNIMISEQIAFKETYYREEVD